MGPKEIGQSVKKCIELCVRVA